MSQPWLLIAFSCFGPVSLQYIDTGSLAPDAFLDIQATNLQNPYTQFYSQPPSSESLQNEGRSGFQTGQNELLRMRRMASDNEIEKWAPNLVDVDKTSYFRNNDVAPTNQAEPEIVADNTEVEKKSFSPWGGKRDRPHASFEHMWSWKRSSGIREPSMPKRVRFSPWGGKRSGQMIYKPGSKGSKIIFFSSIPELTRIVSNYSPVGKRLDMAGFQFIPGMDKRHPIKIMALSSSMDERTLRDSLPFNTLTEQSPKLFKLGHPYNEVHLKKDGKRKTKFSIWGGKRSPPIIGPIWTPANVDMQDSALNTILLLRNKQSEALNSI